MSAPGPLLWLSIYQSIMGLGNPDDRIMCEDVWLRQRLNDDGVILHHAVFLENTSEACLAQRIKD